MLRPKPVELYYTAEDSLFDRSEVLKELACLLAAFLIAAAYWRFV